MISRISPPWLATRDEEKFKDRSQERSKGCEDETSIRPKTESLDEDGEKVLEW